MDYDRETGPLGRSCTISRGGDIPWKGKEERCLFGTGWKISLSPWIGFWLAWDSVSGYSGMPQVCVWECIRNHGIMRPVRPVRLNAHGAQVTNSRL